MKHAELAAHHVDAGRDVIPSLVQYKQVVGLQFGGNRARSHYHVLRIGCASVLKITVLKSSASGGANSK